MQSFISIKGDIMSYRDDITVELKQTASKGESLHTIQQEANEPGVVPNAPCAIDSSGGPILNLHSLPSSEVQVDGAWTLLSA